jgi:WD40 repeat protein
LLAANYRYVAFPLETSGGGLFTVLPAGGNGKIGTSAPQFKGHSGSVLDVAFNPFNDNIIASAAEDATLRVWQIECNDGVVKPQDKQLAIMKGHARKVTRLVWNPAVNGCIATFGAENSVKIWDVAKAQCVQTFKPGKDAQLDINWNANGNLLIFPMKDKKIHCYDPRANAETFAVQGHAGLRGARAIYYDKLNLIASTGFSATSQRQIMVRDARNPEKPLASIDVDNNNGILAPFIDQDLGVLSVFSRGDTIIRYYDLQSEENPLVTLTPFQCKEAVRAFAMAPKYCVDTSICEIGRFYFVSQAKVLHKCQLVVPRKNAEIFQDDLYPETALPKAGAEFEAWMGGAEPQVEKFSLENGYTPVDGPEFSVNAAPEETLESVKAENAMLKKRIAELEEELRKYKE